MIRIESRDTCPDTSLLGQFFAKRIFRKRPRIGSGGSAFESSAREESNEPGFEALSLKGTQLWHFENWGGGGGGPPPPPADFAGY